MDSVRNGLAAALLAACTAPAPVVAGAPALLAAGGAPVLLVAAAAPVLLMASAMPASAEEQVSGPIQIGPSWGQGDPQHSSALLSTIITNRGGVADRLIRAECPTAGGMALRNGTLHRDVEVPTLDQQQAALAQRQDPNAPHPLQNGLDLPPRLHEQVHPVTAQFDLSQARQPITDGALVPCSLYFAHGGQRIVVFGIGETPTPTSEP